MVGKSDQDFINMHLFLDEINNLLDSLEIVRRRLYADAWKVGMAYQHYGKEKVSYALYPILPEVNDVQIKWVQRDFLINLNMVYSVKSHLIENPIETRPVQYSKERIYEDFEKVLENSLLDHNCNIPLAREFIFSFVDNFHEQLGLDQKDKYTVKELKEGYYIYLPFWIEEAIKLLEETRSEFRLGDNYIDINLIKTYFLEEELQEISERVRSRMEKEGEETKKYPIGNDELSPRKFVEYLSYLEDKGVNELSRLFRPGDFSRFEDRNNLVWNMYSPKDIKENLRIYFDNLPEVYKDIIEKNLPGLVGKIPLYGEATKILVDYDKPKDEYVDRSEVPSLYMIFLKEKNGNDSQELSIELSEEGVEDYSIPDSNEEIEIDGKTYEIVSWSQNFRGLPFVNEKLPLKEFVYERLEKNVKQYLGIEDSFI